MSRIARDLQRHLSQRLQATIREHADRASIMLEPADTLYMMLQCAVDASCCAIASIAGTLAQFSEPGEDDRLVAMLVEQHGKMLASAIPEMKSKIVEALVARGGALA